MNIKQRILELNRQCKNEDTKIDDLLITLMTRFQLFEPCKYISEDEEWISICLISLENENMSQPMSIKKCEITMFGIFNPEEIEMNQIKTEPEDFYQ